MWQTGGAVRRLEQIQMSLAEKVPLLLMEFGASVEGESWFVSLSFKRPLPPWRRVRMRLREGLKAFSQGRLRVSSRIPVEPNLTIHFDRARSVHDDFFVFGGYSDHDEGGWVLSELERNIAICLREKSTKTSLLRAKYPEWWLVLIDHISYTRIDGTDLTQLRKRLPGLADWDRVLLVNPLDPTQSVQIWPGELPGQWSHLAV
jgi:hypothetical protein